MRYSPDIFQNKKMSESIEIYRLTPAAEIAKRVHILQTNKIVKFINDNILSLFEKNLTRVLKITAKPYPEGMVGFDFNIYAVVNNDGEYKLTYTLCSDTLTIPILDRLLTSSGFITEQTDDFFNVTLPIIDEIHSIENTFPMKVDVPIQNEFPKKKVLTLDDLKVLLNNTKAGNIQNVEKMFKIHDIPQNEFWEVVNSAVFYDNLAVLIYLTKDKMFDWWKLVDIVKHTSLDYAKFTKTFLREKGYTFI